MNYADRISNQTTIYYSQGRYNPRLCKRLPSADGFFPKSMRNKGEEELANEWVARNGSELSSDSISATDHASGNSHPAVFFQRSLIDSQAEKFKFCLVGKFSQWRPSLSQIRVLVSRKWKLQGHCSVTLLDHRHVLIRLDNEEDMIHVWTRNRWVIGGHLMRVFKWFPTFIPSKGEPSSAAVWVSLPSLPLVFFQEELLLPIASLAGSVIAVDDSTRNLSRTNVARVCVEVDLLKEPPRRVWVGIGEEGFWQDMCYRRLPPFCINCREQGHSSETCSVHINSDCDSSTGMSDSKPCSGINRESRRPEDFFDRTKRLRISSIEEDGEGSGHPTQLGLRQTEEEKGKEIAKEIVDGEAESSSDSSRSCSCSETQGGTWNREGCSPATTELNLPVEKSSGIPDAQICASEKSGFSVSTRHKFFLRRLNLFLGRNKQKELIPPSLPFSNVVKFNYSEIKKMINLGDKLGESSLGTVFRGKFQDDQEVAVTVLKQSRFEGDEEFARELRVLTSTSHANIIRLLGFCSQGSKRVLVFELLKCDLTQIISSKESVLKNQSLFKIALNIARGFEYLHQELDPSLLPLRVDPSSILLDEEFRPKLWDFGLSPAPVRPALDKYAGDTVDQYSSPELTRAADVYSYGIILLEMALGRKARNRQEEIPDVLIHKWVRRRVAAMGGLEGITLDEIERKIVIVALWCTQEDPALRPSFTSVIAMLQASIDDIYLPHLSGNGIEV